ncbi:MAG: hypothetical protein ACKO24_08105 [Leptolyngbyaceae cyanobacterium]
MSNEDPSREMPEKVQIQLLQTLEGLPPVSAIGKVPTSTLTTIHDHFQDLRVMLSAYFSGSEDPIQGSRPVTVSRLLREDLDFYLKTYNFLWFCWREIKAELRNQEIECSSPGDALAAILQWECESQLEASRHNISIREAKAILGGISKGSSRSGTAKKRQERTNQYRQEVFDRVNGAELFLKVCKQGVKKQLRGNSMARSRLLEFEAAEKQRFKNRKQQLVGVKGSKFG